MTFLLPPGLKELNGTKYSKMQEWTKEKLWKTAFKKFEGISKFLKAVFHIFYLRVSFFTQLPSDNPSGQKLNPNGSRKIETFPR